MKIKSFRSWLEKLPLSKPYTIAYSTSEDAEIVFLELVLENGITGLGAASPFEEVVGEKPSHTLANLQSGFLETLTGRDIRHFNQLIDEAAAYFPHLPGTLAAIDIALHDAFGKFMGVSVLEFYGQKIAPLPTSVTIGIKDINGTLADAREYLAMGFRVLKIKTGLDAEQDIERVLRLREVFSSSLVLRVDANQGYDLINLKRFLTATAKADIELIEQPLPSGADKDLLQLSPTERSILVADESLLDASAAFRLAHTPHRYGVFNIKLMKCGGIRAAREIALLAGKGGIGLFWGCNDESVVSITAALHAALSCSNTRYLDLDGSLELSRDLATGGFSIENGCLIPAKGPGLGLGV
ncbi:mandelate racemase/muconate lactonizing enzyme family protein [Flavihumibacter stibioxidans]|uniref:Dipeptide epimerase n=1 Tax=Flavihumibacter stibioxidans TaxID=1834163 RepID=A0ABR7M7W6_9BACT|nr:dipeptide epimerase [Flavihumibacter stibioxidans]MBC6491062.1 dipeptide epimerase [Flavihumibacter stibioxidans]